MPAAIARMGSMFIVALYALTFGCAMAQSPAVNSVDADYAAQQQKRQLEQPLNNQPLWSEARSGQPQFTSIPGRETNVLIQSRGQTWRALRSPRWYRASFRHGGCFPRLETWRLQAPRRSMTTPQSGLHENCSGSTRWRFRATISR